MGKKRVLILLVFAIIYIVFFIFNNQESFEKNDFTKTNLSQKEEVLDETQFVFKPIIEEMGEEKQLKVLLEITSYMNPDILEIDYREQAMLEVKDDFSLPVEWHILEKTKYKVIGQLIFKLNSEPLGNFGLKIFTYSDHEIAWD